MGRWQQRMRCRRAKLVLHCMAMARAGVWPCWRSCCDADAVCQPPGLQPLALSWPAACSRVLLMGSFVSSALCPHPSFFIDPFSALLCYHCGSRARLRCRSRALRLGRREVSCAQRAEVGFAEPAGTVGSVAGSASGTWASRRAHAMSLDKNQREKGTGSSFSSWDPFCAALA